MLQFVSFFKPVALLLTLSILFQGCSIYYRQPVSSEEAFESNQKVKIVYFDGRKEYFKKLEMEDDILYGIKKYKGKLYKISLHKDEIKEIHLKNKRASTVTTVVVLTVVPIGIFFTIGFISIMVEGWGWYP